MDGKRPKTGGRRTLAKRALLAIGVTCFLGLFLYTLTFPPPGKLTEVSSVTVIDTPMPVLLLPTTPPSSPPPVPAPRKLDLNAADAWMLCAVPGLGEETARRIIEYRDLVGGFTDVVELKRVSGIGESTYARIEPYLYCGEETKEDS